VRIDQTSCGGRRRPGNDVPGLVELKERFDANLEAGKLREAGYNVANYVVGLGGLKESVLALVPNLRQAKCLREQWC
jgi:hypothetical protein